MLTRRQQHVYQCLVSAMQANGGIAPSFDEMAAAVGTSKANIWRLINSLEERGFIRRLHNRARAIQILRPAERDESWADNGVAFVAFFRFDDDSKRLVPWSGAVSATAPKRID